MQKNSAQFVAYAIAVLMFMTGIVYLTVAYGENNESVEKQTAELKDHAGTSSAQRESEESEMNENDRNIATNEKGEQKGTGPILETMFFSSVGVAYFPVGIWMISNKDKSAKPYTIALIGSVSLIAFYVATRTLNLPMIGLQDDIGFTDIASKVLQGAIIATSVYMIPIITKTRKAEKLV